MSMKDYEDRRFFWGVTVPGIIAVAVTICAAIFAYYTLVR